VPASQTQPIATAKDKPWGVPGEEHSLLVVPRFREQELLPKPEETKGLPGKYKIQLLLCRPGYPLSGERQHAFIDDLIGDSHILIAKPLNERGPEDTVSVLLKASGHGKQLNFTGLPNVNGFLGKLIVEELDALNFADAEKQAYELLAPFLSSWSLHLDIPVHVETMQMTHLATHASSLRVRTPHFEMTFPAGLTPPLTDDFCHYASLYREGMNTNSGFYRFLCFYKIIESIPLRRGRTNEAAKEAGQQVRRFREVIPATQGELIALLQDVYPWRKQWDSFALDQMIPPEASGKKIGWVREKHLNPLRVGIAHALLHTGEVTMTFDKLEHVQQVNRWLPLCRTLARLLLRNEFPDEFALTMKPFLLTIPTTA
jgi:hypothetical protein